jgi:beta-lactam-binding protein with PASTA domain
VPPEIAPATIAAPAVEPESEPESIAPVAPVAGRPSQEVIEEWARAFEEPVVSPDAPVAVAEPRPPIAPRLRALLTWIAIALLAFATGFFLFNNFVMPRLIHGVGQVTVPDLTNLTYEQAEQTLRPFGLQASRAGERFDAVVPRGFVLQQDPEAGSTVRGRKRVSVTLSLGEEFSSVPELFGESPRGARILLERAGLLQGTVVQAPSDEAGEGLVAASDPGAEAVLQRNTAVHLLVSTGSGPESYVMPELLGREVGSVRRQLEAMGFRIERTGSRTSVGTIVAQVPAPGSRITRASVIQLTASGRIIR